MVYACIGLYPSVYTLGQYYVTDCVHGRYHTQCGHCAGDMNRRDFFSNFERRSQEQKPRFFRYDRHHYIKYGFRPFPPH